MGHPRVDAHLTAVRSDAGRLARHKSIMEYFHAQGFSDSLATFKREVVSEYEPGEPKSKYVNLIEKKWVSVIRLQKKVR